MRENRMHGSEGGAETSLPLSGVLNISRCYEMTNNGFIWVQAFKNLQELYMERLSVQSLRSLFVLKQLQYLNIKKCTHISITQKYALLSKIDEVEADPMTFFDEIVGKLAQVFEKICI